MKVKFLAKEHNAVTLASAAWSGATEPSSANIQGTKEISIFHFHCRKIFSKANNLSTLISNSLYETKYCIKVHKNNFLILDKKKSVYNVEYHDPHNICSIIINGCFDTP